MHRTHLSWIALAALVSACAGTDVGNPTVDIHFALLQTEPTLAVERAWLAVERVRLRSAVDCNGGTDEELEGPYAIDLLAAGPPQALTGVAIPSGGYCRFELKWQAFSSGLPPGTPDELVEASIFLAGRSAASVPFLVRSARDDELRLDAVGGEFTIDETTQALFLALDSTRLFTGVDLDAAELEADGTIVVDGETNTELLRIFDANLRAAARLFRDEDGNGELDPDESQDDRALAD